jgi:hypothetical protein
MSRDAMFCVRTSLIEACLAAQYPMEGPAMLNEIAIAWLLAFSVTPPPGTVQASGGRVRHVYQAKCMQVAPVSPQHKALLAPQERESASQKPGQHSPPGMIWYRQPEAKLHSPQAGSQAGGFAAEPPLEPGSGQDNVDDKFDYGDHDYNKAKVRSAGKLVRT